MATIIPLSDILTVLETIDVIVAMEQGFVQYSNGQAVVPPVGELLFDHPKGEAHIKYGYIKQTDYYCIKIASGFYDNPKFGIASSQGLMLLFSQLTGEPKAILLDEGKLTDVRTAAAGALVAQYFAPKDIKAIGILGTGTQARLQLQYLQKVTPCRKVWVWGRNRTNAQQFKTEMEGELEINIAESPTEVAQHCNLIVTTTPAETPLLQASDILPGTHITAVGSDTSTKQELASDLLGKADLLIADSIAQSQSRGEIYRATSDGEVDASRVVELGAAIQNENLQRINDEQISIADLTGVAVQDIMISQAVYINYLNKEV
ncbi:MAG TPA: ornithine cyclodeaminase family protein [Microscillaceae bacterium]|nr:ornithine cyclodeaminase family protein [Microscillaceae bacterium]